MQGKLNAEPLRIVPADDEPNGNVADEVAVISGLPLVGAGRLTPSDLKFVAVGCNVIWGADSVLTARSHTFARRTANALNAYTPHKRKGY